MTTARQCGVEGCMEDRCDSVPVPGRHSRCDVCKGHWLEVMGYHHQSDLTTTKATCKKPRPRRRATCEGTNVRGDACGNHATRPGIDPIWCHFHVPQ